MNCVLFKKGSDEISMFIVDCVQYGKDFFGTSGGKYTGLNLDVWGLKWTPDTATFTEGVGWDKKPSEMASAQGIEIAKPTSTDYINALTRLKDIEGRSYTQIDDYIDSTVVDLASAKVVLKLIAKVLLALIKVLGHKGRL